MPSEKPRLAATGFERHQRKCTVCHHEDRAAIEDYFIHWNRPAWIASFFKITEDSLFRHAFAAGLYQLRSARVRFALEHIIERVNQASVTASSVVDAVRAYTRIDSRGRWAEPPTIHIVVPAAASGPERSRRAPAPPSQLTVRTTNRDPGACPSRDAGTLVSNRVSEELENAATR